MAELLGQLEHALGTTYRLARELGGGGMSRVFLAEETALGRRVVIKVLPEELARGLSAERFRREILVAARLHHPHIVPLLTAGDADGLLYYTMPFIEGESLRARLDREGELPVPETLRILRDVADALAYAHQHGLVHRDIKPGNVLLAGHHAVVADFGVAKAVSEAVGEGTLTSVGLALGTPAYMSPEQASADPHTDHRADIYCLGVLAYQMLAGRLPFTDSSTQRLLAAHITQRPEPLASVRPSIPPALDSVVMRCLEKRPADRWQRAEDLVAALEAAATPSTGTVVTPAPAAEGRPGATAVPRRGGRRLARAAIALGAAGAAFLGLAATGVLRHRTLVAEGALAARDRVLITDFENRTPDSTLGLAVTEAFRVDLTQSPVIKVVSPEQARDALARMRRDTTAALDYALGREVALRDGIKAVVAGDISAVGGQYVVSARLVSPAKGDVLAAYRATADGPGGIIRAVDKVSKQLRGRIGESLRAVAGAPSLEMVTTSSLDALRSYSQAIRLSGGADHDRALALLDQAVKLDSNFASAWRAMGITLSNWGDDPQRMTEAFTRAYRLRDRLTPRERYSAEAAYFTNVDPQPDKVVAAYEAMLELNPDDFTALNNLGIYYYFRGNDARALSYYRRAAARPTPIGFGNLIDAQYALGDLAGVDSTMKTWRARFPGDPYYGRYEFDLAAAEGRYDSARTLARAYVERNRDSRGWRHVGNEALAGLARVQGRLQESERFEDAANDAASGPDSAALATLGKTMTRVSSDVVYRGRSAQAADRLRDLLATGVLARIAPLNRPYADLAFTFARAGRPDLAREMLAEQERALAAAGDAGRLAIAKRRADPYNRGVAGVIQAAEGKPAKAVVTLRALDAELGHVWVLPDLGRAYDAAGQTDSAVAVYERYLTGRMTDRIGLDSWNLPRVLFRLGELYEARGDRARAAEYYGRFVRLWSGADADLQPRVAEAKRRLAALTAEPA